MNVAENLTNIKNQLPPEVNVVAVSKTKPNELIEQAYQTGHRIFGENKVQEMAQKYEDLPKDIQWHMIGHLQTNKVKYLASFVSLIHSADRLKLIKEIDKRAKEHNRTIDCLLQIHIANEEHKFGFGIEEIKEIMANERLKDFSNVRIAGLMGMSTLTDDEQQIRNEFKSLKHLFDELKTKYFIDNPSFNILSMGMSGDYPIAIEEGSNMVRIGSAIFGVRN